MQKRIRLFTAEDDTQQKQLSWRENNKLSWSNWTMNYRSWASWWRLWWGFSSVHCRRRRSSRCPAPPPAWTPPSGAPTRLWDKDPRSGSPAFSEGGNTHIDSQVIKHTSTVNDSYQYIQAGSRAHTRSRFSLNVLVLSPRTPKIFSFRRWIWEQTF